MAQYGLDVSQRWRNPGLLRPQRQPYIGGLGQGRSASPGGGSTGGPPVFQPPVAQPGPIQGGGFNDINPIYGPPIGGMPGGTPGPVPAQHPPPGIPGGMPGPVGGGPQTWFGPQPQPSTFDPSSHPMLQLAALALLHHGIQSGGVR